MLLNCNAFYIIKIARFKWRQTKGSHQIKTNAHEVWPKILHDYFHDTEKQLEKLYYGCTNSFINNKTIYLSQINMFSNIYLMLLIIHCSNFLFLFLFQVCVNNSRHGSSTTFQQGFCGFIDCSKIKLGIYYDFIAYGIV